MHNQTDEALIQCVKEGEITSYELLVKRYEGKLIRFVTRIVKDRHSAEEVVQDSFFAIYTHIDRIDTSRKFTTYLFEIAKNTALSLLRKRKPSVSLEEIEEIATDESLYEYLLGQERADRIGQALDGLDHKYERVIRLYYFDSLSYEEIGRRLKLPVNTVRTHLSRAKRGLKKLLTYENE